MYYATKGLNTSETQISLHKKTKANLIFDKLESKQIPR